MIVMSNLSMLVIAAVVACLVPDTHALDNGLAITPAMGWMSWERFRCVTDCVAEPDNCICAKLLMQMADRMAEDGYLEAGYEYLAVDDCWMAPERNQTDGRLMADPVRFPNGMKAVVDYVHSKGLKFGIYGDVGTKTCQRYPGNMFYLPLDAETYASWGVDMMKIDCCYASQFAEGIETMGFFLNRTGRPFLYVCASCVNSGQENYSFGAKICNAVRVTMDVTDSWQNVYQIIDFIGKNQGNMAEQAGPGYWNDADELVVGDFGLSIGQQRAQMGIWAIIASPLFMSVDLRNIDAEAKKILLNKQIIAINQDPLGIQGKRIFKYPAPQGFVECWLRPLSPKGTYAVGILNANTDGKLEFVNVTMVQLGLTDPSGYTMTEVFTDKKYGPFNLSDRLTVQMPPTSLFLAVAVPRSHSKLHTG